MPTAVGAADGAAGLTSNTAFTQHVAHRGTDGHATGAPPSTADAATSHVVAFQQTLHFDYTRIDGPVHDL